MSDGTNTASATNPESVLKCICERPIRPCKFDEAVCEIVYDIGIDTRSGEALIFWLDSLANERLRMAASVSVRATTRGLSGKLIQALKD
jgi:hypothetical protein